MKTEFLPHQLLDLKFHYRDLKTISMDRAKSLNDLIRVLPTKALSQLANADIEFVSMTAQTYLRDK